MNAEVLKKAESCKNVSELVAYAKSNGLELSEEAAGKIFAVLHKDVLSDEEMDMICGGGDPVCEKWMTRSV